MPPKKKRRRRSKAVHKMRVWGYPKTADNEGPIDWAWGCRCGSHAHGLTEVAARAAAAAHLEEHRDQ